MGRTVPVLSPQIPVYFRRVELQGRAFKECGLQDEGQLPLLEGKPKTYPRISPEHETELHFHSCLLKPSL